jgi:hypothetical protein
MDNKSKIVFTLLLNSYLYALDISQLPIDSMIEIIKSNNKETLQIIPSNIDARPIHYTPSNEHNYSIEFKKKRYDSKYGILDIYDLSHNNQYLNAINFTNLQIEGNLNGCRLALSDKQMFQQEDNLIIKNNSNINFNEIYQKIDLSRLKYLILFNKSNQCNINKLVLINNRQEKIDPKNYARSSWVWQPKNIKDEYKLDKFNIKTVYMQMNNNFTAATTRLPHKQIYGLNGSPSDIYNYQHLINDIHKLSKIKKSNNNIIGYQVDIEPYLLAEYSSKREEILQKYIDTLNSLKHVCHENGLKFSIVIPFWYSNLYIDNKNLAHIVVDIADEIVLMSYRSDLTKVIDISKDILSMGSFSNKPVKIGIELMKIEDEKHTIYKIVSKDCLENQAVNPKCKSMIKIKDYTVLGSSISFYNQTYKLKNLDSISIPYNSFNGFTLHFYSKLPLVSF